MSEKVIPSRVAGVSYRQPWVRLLKKARNKNPTLRLLREPTNPADPFAVAVFAPIPDHGWHHIGYLTRSVAPEVSEALEAGYHCFAQVAEYTGGSTSKPTIGVNIEIHLTEKSASDSFTPPFLIPPEPYAFPRAGWLAPKARKTFFKGVRLYLMGAYEKGHAQWLQVLPHEPLAAVFAALHLSYRDDPQALAQATQWLETILRQNLDYQTLAKKKFRAFHFLLPIPAELIYLSFEEWSPSLHPADLALVLAGLYYRLERASQAISLLRAVLNRHPQHRLVRLVLANLHLTQQQWEPAIRLLARVDFQADNLALALAYAYARALYGQDLLDAAQEVLSQHFRRKKSKAPLLLQRGQFLKALIYKDRGRLAQAIKTLEKLYAQNPLFPDLDATLRTWKREQRQKSKAKARR